MPKPAKRSRSKGSYSVGYGKPPPQHRFKPGKSGNNKGRPKSLPELSELTAKELRRRGHVMIEGKRVSISMLELVVKKLIAGAAKGNPKSLNFLVEMLGKHEANERKQASLSLGTTIREGMTEKEAADEYARWFKEISSQDFDDDQ
jgi:hypothetical protein